MSSNPFSLLDQRTLVLGTCGGMAASVALAGLPQLAWPGHTLRDPLHVGIGMLLLFPLVVGVLHARWAATPDTPRAAMQGALTGSIVGLLGALPGPFMVASAFGTDPLLKVAATNPSKDRLPELASVAVGDALTQGFAWLAGVVRVCGSDRRDLDEQLRKLRVRALMRVRMLWERPAQGKMSRRQRQKAQSMLRGQS